MLVSLIVNGILERLGHTKMNKQIKKNNIKELQRQTLINILNVKGIIYTHYKNKQKGNHEKNNTTIQCAKNILC